MGIHDDICQKLVVSNMALESSMQLIQDARLSSSLKIVSESISDIIEEATSLTFSLSSPVLHELGLVVAIKDYLDREIRKKHGIAFELDGDDHVGDLDDQVKNLLFRISRELLMNVVKHARAGKIKVSVRKRDGGLCISVRDDGVGFKKIQVDSDVSKGTRFGLFSVREQLEQLGGRLEIESEPGRGTTATVVIPLTE